MAVCELPPLCSKSTPLKKKTTATTVACQKHPLSKKLPLLHVRSTPSARKAPPLKKSHPCCTSKVPPLLEKHPLSKKKHPLSKKSTPSQKKRGNFGGFHLPYIIGTVPLKSGQLDSQSYSVAVLCKQSLFDLKSIPIMT